MILESTVIMTDWLKGPVHGVNAILPSIPRKKVDLGSATFAKPNPVTVYDDIRDESVAMKLDPDKSPALVVFCDSDVDVPMEWGATRILKGNRIVMAVCYLYRDMPPLVARQEGMFVLRAVQWSLKRFNTDRNSNGKRRLNDISITSIIRTRQQRVTGAIGESTLAGFVLADLDVIDHAA